MEEGLVTAEIPVECVVVLGGARVVEALVAAELVGAQAGYKNESSGGLKERRDFESSQIHIA